MGHHAPLKGIFLTQGLNPGLSHCKQTLYHLSYQGTPIYLFIVYGIKRGDKTEYRKDHLCKTEYEKDAINPKECLKRGLLLLLLSRFSRVRLCATP